MRTVFPGLLLTFISPLCIALSPLGGTATIVEGGKSQQPYPLQNALHCRDLPDDVLGPTKSASSLSTHLSMVGAAGGYASPEPSHPQQKSQIKQRWTEYVVAPDPQVPTITQKEPLRLGQMPPRPKAVVFGASGRIGRKVLKKLLGSGMDMDVVAFVRDAKKLERALYDEEDLVVDLLDRKRGPRLQIMEGNVVSRRDVYGCKFEKDREKKALDTRGEAIFNSTKINYDTNEKVSADVHVLESEGEKVFRDAISGSTILISCLGTFRPSNIWTDYLRVPILRVFRQDVSKWCSDPAHPYYVNYLSTKKILHEAEKEQIRRDTLMELDRERLASEEAIRERLGVRKEEKGFENEIAARLAEMRNKRSSLSRDRFDYDSHGEEIHFPRNGLRASSSDRIKFIRISHLMVGRSPFRVWSVIANVLWSQLSRFELLAELLMENSKVVDTIVLRPGDLTDGERNQNHTSLQLCVEGRVDSPALVGRQDIADLVVVSALTKTSLNKTDTTMPRCPNNICSPAHHFTWAMRWTGQHLSPPQGLRPDGLRSVALCFVKAVEEQALLEGRRRSEEDKIKSYHGGKELLRLESWRRRRLRPFVHSLAVSVPLYTSMAFLVWYLFGQVFVDLSVRLRRWNVPQLLLKLLLR